MIFFLFFLLKRDVMFFFMNDTVRIVKDFPKKGINFYDISSILAKPQEFKKSLDKMISITKKMKPTAIAGIDSRGFLFASIVLP